MAGDKKASPKADALRAMREANFAARQAAQPPTPKQKSTKEKKPRG